MESEQEKLISSVGIKERLGELVRLKKAFPAVSIKSMLCGSLFTRSELLSDEFIDNYDYDSDPASLMPSLKAFADPNTGEISEEIAEAEKNAPKSAKLLIGLFGITGVGDIDSMPDSNDKISPLLDRVFDMMTKMDPKVIDYIARYSAYSNHNDIQLKNSAYGSWFCSSQRRVPEVAFSCAINRKFRDPNIILDSILAGTFDEYVKTFMKFHSFSAEYFTSEDVEMMNESVKNAYHVAITSMYKTKSTKDIQRIKDYFSNTELGKKENEEYSLSGEFVEPTTMFLNPNLTDKEIDSEITSKFSSNKQVDIAISVLNEKFTNESISLDEVGVMIKRCILDNKHARDNICKADKARLVHRALSGILFGKANYNAGTVGYRVKYVSDESGKKEFRRFVDSYKDYIFDYDWLAAAIQYNSYIEGYYGNYYSQNVREFFSALAKYRKEDKNESYYFAKFTKAIIDSLESRDIGFAPETTDWSSPKKSTVQGKTMLDFSLGNIFYVEDAITRGSDVDCGVRTNGGFDFSNSKDMISYANYVVKNADSIASDRGDKKKKIIAALLTLAEYYNGLYQNTVVFDKSEANINYDNGKRICEYYGIGNKFMSTADYLLYIVGNPSDIKYINYYSSSSFNRRSVFGKMMTLQSIYSSTIRFVTDSVITQFPVEPGDVSPIQRTIIMDEVIPEIKGVLNPKGITVGMFLKETSIISLDGMQLICSLLENKEHKLYETGEMPKSVILLPSNERGYNGPASVLEYLNNEYSKGSDDARKFIDMALSASWMSPTYDDSIMKTVLDMDRIVNFSRYNQDSNKKSPYPDWFGACPRNYDSDGKIINLTSSNEYLYPGCSYSEEINSSGAEGLLMPRLYKFVSEVSLPFLTKHEAITPDQERDINSNCYDAMNSYLVITNSVFH